MAYGMILKLLVMKLPRVSNTGQLPRTVQLELYIRFLVFSFVLNPPVNTVELFLHKAVGKILS